MRSTRERSDGDGSTNLMRQNAARKSFPSPEISSCGLFPLMSHYLVTGGAGFIGSHITTRLAAEGLGDDVRPVMIAVAGQVLDPHLRVRQAHLDQALDLDSAHRHRWKAPSQTSAPAAM